MDAAEVHRKKALLCNKKDSGNFWKEIRCLLCIPGHEYGKIVTGVTYRKQIWAF